MATARTNVAEGIIDAFVHQPRIVQWTRLSPARGGPAPPPPPAPAAASPAATASIDWHTQTAAQVVQRFGTAATGLTGAEARRRLEQFGPNELQASERAVCVAYARRAVQERPDPDPAGRHDRLGPARAHARGDRHHRHRAVRRAAGLLPGVPRRARARGAAGDGRAGRARAPRRRRERRRRRATSCRAIVVVLRAGDRVPADARVVEADQPRRRRSGADRRIRAVDKTTERCPSRSWPLGDRTNMAYAGTLVTHGRGQAIVVATGMATEFGQIAQLVQTVEAGRTPLQENLDALGARSARPRSVVVALVVALGLLARAAADRHVHVRHRARRGRRARSAAGRRHDLARDRRAPHGQAARARPPAARRRDAGQHLGDLLRQDRHADAERDDGAPAVRGRHRASRSPAPATIRSASSARRRRAVDPPNRLR